MQNKHMHEKPPSGMLQTRRFISEKNLKKALMCIYEETNKVCIVHRLFTVQTDSPNANLLLHNE